MGRRRRQLRATERKRLPRPLWPTRQHWRGAKAAALTAAALAALAALAAAALTAAVLAAMQAAAVPIEPEKD
jgi:hypothetical protein